MKYFWLLKSKIFGHLEILAISFNIHQTHTLILLKNIWWYFLDIHIYLYSCIHILHVYFICCLSVLILARDFTNKFLLGKTASCHGNCFPQHSRVSWLKNIRPWRLQMSLIQCSLNLYPRALPTYALKGLLCCCC